jgi:hypothetical protein
MTTYEEALLIPSGAAIFIPADTTVPLLLISGAVVLPKLHSLPPPAPETIWSQEEPNLSILDLLNIQLYPYEFYRKLESQGKEEWQHGAHSLKGLLPGTRLPFWGITYAKKMVSVIVSKQAWLNAFTFISSISTFPPHLAHVIPSVKKLFEVIGHDIFISRNLRTSDLPILLSRSKVPGRMIDAFVAVLSRLLEQRGKRFSDLYIADTQFMDGLRNDEEWKSYESSKRLKHVRRTKPPDTS